MKCKNPDHGQFRVWPFIAGIVLYALAVGPCRGAEKLPESSELTRRMIERALAVARGEHTPHYTYEKRSLLEHLDASGQTNTTEQKLYQVTLIAGYPFNRLVKVQGRDLTSEESKKEERKEERFRQRYVGADPKKMAARKESWVTQQLLDRYEFVVQERVLVKNRPTLVVNFKPKAENLPNQAIQDRILNRMAGTLWVDEQDADTARISAHLTETASLGWFGVLGSLSRCDLSLERQRLPDGVWVNLKQVLLIHARKVATAMRFRHTEESSGFKKADKT